MGLLQLAAVMTSYVRVRHMIRDFRAEGLDLPQAVKIMAPRLTSRDAVVMSFMRRKRFATLHRTWGNARRQDDALYGMLESAKVTSPDAFAKESFNVSKKGKVKKGPLFFMTKAAAGGDSDAYGNWVYAAFSTKGKPMKIKQKFCHDCHQAFEDQDSLGYPSEDYRVSGN